MPTNRDTDAFDEAMELLRAYLKAHDEATGTVYLAPAIRAFVNKVDGK